MAAPLAHSLVSRPLFCDLLAHAPLDLERDVSLDRVRESKIRALTAVTDVGTALCTVTPLRLDQARSVVSTATSMAGALWQAAAPTTTPREFYAAEPGLAHAVVDVEPALTGVLDALLTGYAVQTARSLSDRPAPAAAAPRPGPGPPARRPDGAGAVTSAA
nr:hypothetical protein [Streptomyces sp. SPB074]